MRPQSVFVSATPAAWEMEQTGGVFTEQVIRPTGLIDPPVEIRPVAMQVDDLLDELRQVAAARQPRAGHRADQAHGRGPDRVPARAGHPRPLHALRHRDAGAHRDPPRPAPRRLRRAGRHQPAARGPRHPRMRAGRHPRRRQGRLPALRDLADPDHRPRRPQRRRPGHPLRRPRHRLDGARDRRDRAPPREADSPTTRANGITPETVRKNVADVLDGLCHGRHRPVAHHRPRRRRRWSAPTSPPISTACARRCCKAADEPRVRRSRARSATRSSGWKPSTSPSPTTPSPASPRSNSRWKPPSSPAPRPAAADSAAALPGANGAADGPTRPWHEARPTAEERTLDQRVHRSLPSPRGCIAQRSQPPWPATSL